MRYFFCALTLLGLSGLLGCGGSNPVGPINPPPPPPPPSYEVSTLITVYRTAESGAMWSRGTTTDERIGKILLGVDDLSSVVGSTNLNNEAGRDALQAAIERLRVQFQDGDYLIAFDDTRSNLEPFLNDADSDSWSIDGRNGRGRDWPYDSNGNDPDGWTGQIIVTVTKRE